MSDANLSPRTSSMRLIFEYEGENIRLVSQQPVDVAVTGFDVIPDQREGYYVDTQDASGRTLARVPARGAFQSSVEVFPERPGEPIVRVDVAQPRGAFTVVVPVKPNADHVRVVHVTPVQPGVVLPTAPVTSKPPGGPEERELARFPLRLRR